MIVTRAPMRIPLGGGGTDLESYYSLYKGFVLSAAINKYVYVVLNTSAIDGLIRLKYSESEKVKSVDEIRHRGFRESLKFTGVDGGVELATMADSPAGTGLGSSASFTVALTTTLYAFTRQARNLQDLAEDAHTIERLRAGFHGGKQDHYAATFGGLICLDIDTSGKVTVSHPNIAPSVLEKLRANLLLFYTGITRISADIQEQQDIATTKNVPQVVDSLHMTKEIGLQVKATLESGNLERFGELLHTHWENKKLRSGKISSPQIDQWYEIARQNGALGGKVLGAGGGGFLAFYCPDETKSRVKEAMAREGLRHMDYSFDTEGVKVLVNM